MQLMKPSASLYDAIMDDSCKEKDDFSLRHFPKDKKLLERPVVRAFSLFILSRNRFYGRGWT